MIADATDNAYGSWSPYSEAKVSVSDDDVRMKRLCRAVHSAYKAWEPFRTQNRNFVEAYLGPGYGATKDKRKKYINKQHQGTVANAMMLAANRPKVDVESPYQELAPFARTLETAVNNLLGEIHLEETLRRWVLDAYFQIGVIKVHRKDSGYVKFEPNIWMDPGCPFASNVALDDFACDVKAHNWGEVKWAADMYRVPYRDIEEGVKEGIYSKEALECCRPSSKYSTDLDADRIEAFGRGDECDTDEFEPMCDLADVWVAADQKIYTFPVITRRDFQLKPTVIAEMDWQEVDHAPYHILGFYEAPESVMPVSPAALIDELDRLANNLMRKQARRAANQKQGIIVRPEGAQTAKRMKDMADDEIIFGDPSTAVPWATGGINSVTQQFLNEVLMYTDEMGGNLKSRLGMGQQADTAKQEELIQAANNTVLGKMQASMYGATRGLIKSLALELWNDEFKTIVARLPVEGAPGYTFDATWRPGDREGNFLDYNFDVNVYSTIYQPPGMQLQEFTGLLTNVLVPLEQMIAAQGGVLNLQLVCRKFAELSNKPWLNEIVTFGAPPPPEEGPSASIRGSKKPSSTTRTYNRKSTSTATPQGQQVARAQTWAGLASGQQQGAQVGLGGM